MEEIKKSSRQRMIRSIRSFCPLQKKLRVDAATVVGTVLRLWCDRAYPKLRKSRLPWSAPLFAARQTEDFVTLLQRLPFFDAAYWLSTAYAALSEASYRKRLALYFTPPVIARRLIGDLKAAGACFERERFIDPACGGAAFIAIVADQMRQSLAAKGIKGSALLRHVRTHLVGIDIDPVLGALSRYFLQMNFYDEISAHGKAVKFKILKGDSLRSFRGLKGGFDVVLCNPPFRKLSEEETESLRGRGAAKQQAPANLYSLFIELAVSLARPGGLVGLVTPTSFMSGRQFGELRTYLLDKTQVLHIGIITDRERVYLDVQQETALTVVRQIPPPAKGRSQTALSLVEPCGSYEVVGRCRLPNSGGSWPIARDHTDLALIQAAARSPYRLVDYGYTPSVGGFVWNRDSNPVFLHKNHVPRRAKSTTVPLLWSSDIRADGVLRFGVHGNSRNQHRFIDPGREGRPSVRNRPGVILQRVTANEQPRRLVGAVIPSAFVKKHGGYVGENHTVILEQRKGALLRPAEVVQLLASPVIDRYFRSISGSTNVSTFELGQLPLPDPAALRRSLRRGIPMDRALKQLLKS
jgi:adenine-specific DNA-methyltransferase